MISNTDHSIKSACQIGRRLYSISFLTVSLRRIGSPIFGLPYPFGLNGKCLLIIYIATAYSFNFLRQTDPANPRTLVFLKRASFTRSRTLGY